MSEAVAETRDELLSIANGMNLLVPLTFRKSNLMNRLLRIIGLREDSTRRHEELRHILLANASARESVSWSDPSDP